MGSMFVHSKQTSATGPKHSPAQPSEEMTITKVAKSKDDSSIQAKQAPSKPKVVGSVIESSSINNISCHSDNSDLQRQRELFIEQALNNTLIKSPEEKSDPKLLAVSKLFSSPNFATGAKSLSLSVDKHHLEQDEDDSLNNIPIAVVPGNQGGHHSRFKPQADDLTRYIVRRKVVTQTTLFVQLPGPALQLISELIGERLPIFIFTNKMTFKVALQAQLAHFEQQRQQMLAQAARIDM